MNSDNINKKYHNKLFLLTHYELGDIINCSGMVNYFTTLYEEVKLVVNIDYLENMKTLFKHNNKVVFTATKRYGYNGIPLISDDLMKIIKESYDVKLLGIHNLSIKKKEGWANNLPFCFYDEANIPYDVFWNYFKIPEINDTLYKILVKNNITNYVFTHTQVGFGNILFDINTIENTFKVNRDDTFIVCANKNLYDRNHKFYNLAEQFVNKPIFEYIHVIINANYIILSDSSFFCLTLKLPTKVKEIYIKSRVGGIEDYTYINKEPYCSKNDKLPIVKMITF